MVSSLTRRTVMTAQLIDGKLIAQQVRDEVAVKVAKRLETGRSVPTLATVLVGERVGFRNVCFCKTKGVRRTGHGVGQP